MYTIQILRTLLIAIIITYYLACIWYFISDTFNDPNDQDTFNKVYFESGHVSYTQWEKLIVCCYFVLTTLSTVGYGDLTPQSNS